MDFVNVSATQACIFLCVYFVGRKGVKKNTHKKFILLA